METNEDKQFSEMMELLTDFGSAREGDIIKGTVVQTGEDYILVDVGFKAEGILPVSELMGMGEDAKFKVGDVIDVLLEKKEGTKGGHPLISYRKAVQAGFMNRIGEAYETQVEIYARIVRETRGGLVVELNSPAEGPAVPYSMEAFLPASHAGYPPVKDLKSVIGEVVPVRVIEFKRKNIVVSWRLVVEGDVKKKKEELFAKIGEGSTVTGKVKKIVKFGAFVDLGGAEALLHIGDITWGRLKKVEDVLKVGEEIQVRILTFDRDKEKISVGVKQLTPHPWENIEEKYPVGSIVSGRVSGLTSFGAFVEFAEGVEGLIHVSEMSWTKSIRHPSQLLKEGDIVETQILKIDKDKRKMSLGLKQVQPNPWAIVKEKYPPGTRMTGTITHITPFGAFVKMEEGVEGMIHISDISWTQRLRHPEDVLKKGEQVEVVVLNVDVKEERIALGLKQKTDNPYDKYVVGSNIQGKVTRIVKNGAFVELEKDIQGFIHISQMAHGRVEKAEDVVNVGKPVWARITRVEPKDKMIDLSMREYQRSREKAEMEKYINQDIPGPTLRDLIESKKREEEEAAAEEEEE